MKVWGGGKNDHTASFGIIVSEKKGVSEFELLNKSLGHRADPVWKLTWFLKEKGSLNKMGILKMVEWEVGFASWSEVRGVSTWKC